MHARKNKEGGNQMKDNELLFDRKCHVLYSKPCKKEILEMSRNVQSGNTQNLKSPFVNQAACCACTHSRYFAGGSPSGLRV